MAKQGSESTRSSKMETQRRIRIIQEWILQDYATTDIIQQACATWNITRRNAYRYLYFARKFFQEKDDQALETRISYFIARKKKLLRDMDPKERRSAAGVAAANKVLDSMAKMLGITMESIKVVGDPKQPVHVNSSGTYSSHNIDYTALSTEFLETLLKQAGKLRE